MPVCHAGKAGDSIDLITGRADGVGEIVGRISDALAEQSVAAQEIARHVEHISGWPTVRWPPRASPARRRRCPKRRGPADGAEPLPHLMRAEVRPRVTEKIRNF
jgi:hypothetical protein